MNDSLLINRLHFLLAPFDALKHLECDGLTHVFHRILSDENIEHIISVGEVTHKPTNRKIPLHYWIDVAQWRIDYRLRMWLGETPDVPHGIFRTDRYLSVSYVGNPTQLSLLPQPIIQLLFAPFSSTF